MYVYYALILKRGFSRDNLTECGQIRVSCGAPYKTSQSQVVHITYRYTNSYVAHKSQLRLLAYYYRHTLRWRLALAD